MVGNGQISRAQARGVIDEILAGGASELGLFAITVSRV